MSISLAKVAIPHDPKHPFDLNAIMVIGKTQSLRSTSDSDTYEGLRGANCASVSASAASKLMPNDAAR